MEEPIHDSINGRNGNKDKDFEFRLNEVEMKILNNDFKDDIIQTCVKHIENEAVSIKEDNDTKWKTYVLKEHEYIERMVAAAVYAVMSLITGRVERTETACELHANMLDTANDERAALRSGSQNLSERITTLEQKLKASITEDAIAGLNRTFESNAKHLKRINDRVHELEAQLRTEKGRTPASSDDASSDDECQPEIEEMPDSFRKYWDQIGEKVMKQNWDIGDDVTQGIATRLELLLEKMDAQLFAFNQRIILLEEAHTSVNSHPVPPSITCVAGKIHDVEDTDA